MHAVLIILHLLGASIVLGTVFFSLVLLLRKPVVRERIETLFFMRKFGTYAIAWQTITGLLLLIQEWEEKFNQPLFWTKLILIGIDGILAQLVIKKRIQRYLDSPEQVQPITGLKKWTFVSLLVIISVVVIAMIPFAKE